jgi:hypothetical protein
MWKEGKEKKSGASIIVKELESIDQDCFDNADLPASIRDGAGRIGAHKSRSETDSDISGIHAVLGIMLLNLVKMLESQVSLQKYRQELIDRLFYQNQGSQRGIVSIRKIVNEGMQWITALNIIINASCVDKIGVKLRGEKRVRQVSEELLQQPCNAVDIVIEILGIGKVHLRRICIF